ncbi:hypothetical protein H4R23_003046, partial [Coemansia sp. Cherry 401B]
VPVPSRRHRPNADTQRAFRRLCPRVHGYSAALRDGIERVHTRSGRGAASDGVRDCI